MPIRPKHTPSEGWPVALRQFIHREDFLSRRYKEEQLPPAKTPHEQEFVQHQLAATGKQTNALEHELYGLTGKYIQTVEGGTE